MLFTVPRVDMDTDLGRKNVRKFLEAKCLRRGKWSRKWKLQKVNWNTFECCLLSCKEIAVSSVRKRKRGEHHGFLIDGIAARRVEFFRPEQNSRNRKKFEVLHTLRKPLTYWRFLINGFSDCTRLQHFSIQSFVMHGKHVCSAT